MISLLLELKQLGGGYSLYFGDDMIGVLLLDDAAQLLGVEHIECVMPVSHLHCWRCVVSVACHYFYAKALKLNSYLFSKFAASEQQCFTAYGRHNRTNFCHISS